MMRLRSMDLWMTETWRYSQASQSPGGHREAFTGKRGNRRKAWVEHRAPVTLQDLVESASYLSVWSPNRCLTPIATLPNQMQFHMHWNSYGRMAESEFTKSDWDVIMSTWSVSRRSVWYSRFIDKFWDINIWNIEHAILQNKEVVTRRLLLVKLPHTSQQWGLHKNGCRIYLWYIHFTARHL